MSRKGAFPKPAEYLSGRRGAFGETQIGVSYSGFPIYKVRRKRYRCRSMGHEFETDTNHYEAIYTCPECGGSYAVSISDCIELTLETQIKRMEERS